jgi:hypothetical protein
MTPGVRQAHGRSAIAYYALGPTRAKMDVWSPRASPVPVLALGRDG